MNAVKCPVDGREREISTTGWQGIAHPYVSTPHMPFCIRLVFNDAVQNQCMSINLPYSLFPPGKMFQAPDLNLIVEFIFMFYKEKPIDWLLDHILWVKVCNPEKDAVCTETTV